MEPITRRKFVLSAAALTLPLGSLNSRIWAAEPAVSSEETLTFFVTADPQINIPKWGTAGTEETIQTMNALPGKPFPLGGTVGKPVGVIVAGDLVDALGNRENWDLYKSFYDPLGNARLKFPAYELIGNHDLSTGQKPGELNYLQQEFINRNKQRTGQFDFDEHGYHYAWTWGGVRFIQLNIFPGNEPRPVYDNPAPWNDPRLSIEFLKLDLQKRVTDRHQPVVLIWHYGLRGWGLDKWWTPADLTELAKVIKDYNVVLILHGHEHRFDQYQWNGIDVIMSPSPQLDRKSFDTTVESKPKGFLVCRIAKDKIEMGHHAAGGWAETWSKPLRKVATS